MAEANLDTMGAVLARWTMGSAAASAAGLWKDALGADPAEAELRLLALSGQFLGVAVTVEPPAELRTLPDVPELTLPTVPDAVRPLARRLLASQVKNELVHFIAMRGWTLHPGDWMPTASDEDAPDVYAPWRDWSERAVSTAKVQREADDQITPENWADWLPAARKAALTALRRRDPAAARDLLEGKLAGENAETRLSLLGLLTINRSEGDIPLLEAIAARDRAPKVKSLATYLLSRLNSEGTGSSEDIAELKVFFSVRVKGFLRRSRVIQFENAKTAEQIKRRAALLESVDIAAFAGALGLTGEELIAAWPWYTDFNVDHDLISQIVRSGTDALALQAAEIVVDGDASVMHRLLPLLPRLTRERRGALADVVLRRLSSNFERVKTIAGGPAHLADPLATPNGAALLAALGRADAKPTDSTAELQALGQITAHTWAPRVLERLYAAGIVQGDPRLDMLRLNEALEDRGEKP
jgi:hypothetical protein